MIRHGERDPRAATMPESDVAPGLADDLVAHGRKSPHCLRPETLGSPATATGRRQPGARAHPLSRGWVRPARACPRWSAGPRHARWPGPLDRLALAVAARKRRNDGHISTVGIRLQEDVVLRYGHADSLSVSVAGSLGCGRLQVGDLRPARRRLGGACGPRLLVLRASRGECCRRGRCLRCPWRRSRSP
jgi:hypothetical protein